jgi:hypothetical protein
MGSSKRYNDPSPRLCKLNPPPVGVGSAGTCGSTSLLDSLVRGNDTLPGVIGEASDISAFANDTFRIFKLDEEKFFRIVVGGGIA